MPQPFRGLRDMFRWRIPILPSQVINAILPIFSFETMTELVSIDGAGRIVIPKAIREAVGIDESTKLLIAVADHGRLILQKLDVEAVAGRLVREMAGKDVDAIVRKVRKEMKALVRQRYPDLLS